ncbi:hypothetical protein B0J13DRAFT_100997 [Dactylonectria estremocensis]|uniref:Xylanolytic transcriptional activator regulatory domain-containing protein n=1 Tax=Dactylonectria estremocensis TaxID=1079267 RepID=A0A9P9E985_9HYPO|nr:hypothetical protein B0J13DRAFT_100997 [Dactylonectria estremocensis]
MRGPGRNKEYMRNLEVRLQRLESALPSSDAGEPAESSSVLSTPDISTDSPLLAASLDEPAPPEVSEEGHAPSQHASAAPSPAPLLEMDTLEPVVEQTVTPAQSVSSRLHLLFFSEMTKLMEVVNELRKNINHEGFPIVRFVELFPEELAPRIVADAFEAINQLYPVLTQNSLLELFSQHFASGVKSSAQDPGTWAVMNVAIAMITQWKMAETSHDEFMPLMWAFFKNSFSVFPELIIRGRDILACQGLLFMTMFLQGTGAMRTASQLLSATARLSYMVGLNRRALHDKVERSRKAEYMQTFWNIYILDANEAIKSGLPPSIDHHDVSLPLPSEQVSEEFVAVYVPGTSRKINATRCRAELATIQSKMQRQLCSEAFLQHDTATLSRAVIERSNELEAWRTSLPVELQPSVNKTRHAQLELRLVQIHLAYYHCVGKFGAIARRLRDGNPQFDFLDDSQNRPRAIFLPGVCGAAARATIRQTCSLGTHALTLIWRIICYPVAASITLLDEVLADPTGPYAKVDTRLLADFVQFLEKLRVKEGCEIEEVLSGCSKFRDIAKASIRRGDDTLSPGGAAHMGYTGFATENQVKSLRERLSGHYDHMLLAQGLLGNMPVLCADASSVFSDTLGVPEGSNGDFGRFVPKILQPSTYNFHFT